MSHAHIQSDAGRDRSRLPGALALTAAYFVTELVAGWLTGSLALLADAGHVSVWVLIEAYKRFRHPQPIASGPMPLVALVGLGVNAGNIWLLRSASGESLNLKGAYFEVLSDAISSLGVMAAAVVIWLSGWLYADPLVSAGIGLFILPRTAKLMADAVGVLLEGTPAEVNIGEVRAAIAAIGGVADVHDLHIWSLTSGVNAERPHRRDER